MPETATAPSLMPRKPVVFADDIAQPVLLTLVVSDHESVAELQQKSDGRERDEYALTALRIGILSLKHARGQIDADAVKREGERLLVDLKSALDYSRNDIHTNLTNALKEYFDPQNGRFQERVDRHPACCRRLVEGHLRTTGHRRRHRLPGATGAFQKPSGIRPRKCLIPRR